MFNVVSSNSIGALPPVSREAFVRLSRFVELVKTENLLQNLVSEATLPTFWQRHIEDSLQLIPFLNEGLVLDIGSGAGLPGVVIACGTNLPVVLTEPRRKRADFLNRVVDELGLNHRVEVRASKVEAIRSVSPQTIVARAVASLSRIFASAHHLASLDTVWVLPKGRTAFADVSDAEAGWCADVRCQASMTDPSASIIVARRVVRRSM